MQPLTEPLAAATFTERARRGAQEAVFFFFSLPPSAHCGATDGKRHNPRGSVNNTCRDTGT